MLKKIDHHMLYMSDLNGREARRSAVNYSKSAESIAPKISANFLQRNYNYNNTLKPLQDSTTRISFKGFKVEKIPENLTRFMQLSVSQISGEQQKLYNGFISEFITAAKSDASFRKHIGLSSDDAKNLDSENLIKLPQMPLARKFLKVLVSPVTMFKDLAYWCVDSKFGKKLLPSLYKHIQNIKNHDKIVANYKNVIGLSNYIRIQENLYRMRAGLDPITKGDSYLIPLNMMKEKINTLRFKAVDPNKGQYSTKHMMLGNRFVSGSVYAVFLSNDAYNTTMRYSNSKESSEEQRASRAKQEFAKIGMNIYVQNLLLSTFESQINKSMANALLASGVTVAASEVIGRMLVGRPIFPSNKETLDRMEENMQHKNGVMAGIGRLIAGDKRNQKIETDEESQPLIIVENDFFEHSLTGIKTSDDMFLGFKRLSGQKTAPSFKGLGKTQYLFERERLQKVLNYIKLLDPTQGKMFEEIISTSLKGKDKLGNVSIAGKTLDEILSDKSIDKIPVGDTMTFTQRFIKGIGSPVFFVQKTVKSIFGGVKKISGKAQEVTLKDLQDKDFKKYLEKALETPAWTHSPLPPDEKEVKIYKEFLSTKNDNKLEINGVKNLILTLEKRFKLAGISMDSSAADSLNKAKSLLNEIMTKADGANHAEYDANKVSQLNINLARAISTIFLVTDSYNLTMQYSNDDKSEAIKTAKNRAIQEASRIASSAYIMAFTHSIMSKIYNGTLIGAFGTCFMTSLASDSLARAVVGVPILRKSHDELIEIEKKQQESKNPVQKALAYLIGKKIN